ncbi:MAG: bifunctional D-glycero-beta-D-manno-heptose-7-phosphate kinase/D-glycero-beta-D-manno-heptose 1-phosphate adenylyltransferase HldE [Cocleimonas sp.]
MKINLPDFSNATVLVVGDVMLDQYWYGNTRRISPEAPVPIVHVRDDEMRAGGASNVALNITALGAKAKLLGMTGDDDNAEKLEALLSKQQVECHFEKHPDHDTALKLRIIAQHQQMIRLDFEDDFSEVNKSSLLKRFENLLENTDIVIFSDYNKGTLSDVSAMIEQANKKDIPCIVDPKGTDFAKYSGASLITPNWLEFETVVGTCKDETDLYAKGQTLRNSLSLDALLVTRGEDGMSLIRQDKPLFNLPTYAREVFDVTGAGDTVIGTLAASLAADSDIENAVALANLAAGIVVRKLGTATASLAEIHDALKLADEIGYGVVNEDELEQVIQISHNRGEKIIMTNGCFDLMHTGHIDYLQKARELGDKLVVAVNSDESVKVLKGESRPINTLQNRMTMLAALECVDWVVPFTEETPERLYCKVLPDVIVKGGDYKPEDVVGGDCIKAQGGKVQIIDFVEGQSTTKIIEKIKG